MKKYFTTLPYFDEKDIEPILNEIKEILLGNKMLTMSNKVEEFEKGFSAYCECKYGVATNSCTSALEIALNSLGLSKDDEVIIPVQTFIATGSCVLRAGAKVVFCDTDDNFLIDFENLKSKITKNTKAVIIVHFAGLISDKIFKIKDFLKQNNIKLIEDCAHAHGAYIFDENSNKKIKAGNIGDISCFSFYSTKIMTTGEGGMLLTNDENIYKKAASIRNRGIDFEKQDESFINLGSNNRFTEIQALLGLSQLKNLEKFVKHRNKIANIYKTELAGLREKGIVRFQEHSDTSRHSYWRFIVFLNKNDRNIIIKKLDNVGIKADAPYSPLLHKQPLFNSNKILENVEKLANTHISLPIHLKITEDDAKLIANELRRVLK